MLWIRENMYLLLFLAWFCWSSSSTNDATYRWMPPGFFWSPDGAVASFVISPKNRQRYRTTSPFRHQKHSLLSSVQESEVYASNITTTFVAASDTTSNRPAIREYHLLNIAISTTLQPRQEIIAYDLTKTLQRLAAERDIQFGTLLLYNRHTTTSLLINEYEPRLLRDLQRTALQMIPPDARSSIPGTAHYEHNDLEERPASPAEWQRCFENGWNITQPDVLEQWRQQEPINAHAHLLSVMFGSNSQTIPIVQSQLQIGAWQSVLLLDWDGPRPRTVGAQLVGY
jgi:thiamine phosphate synthase YjbQ (UPF0047 family)